MDAIFTADSHDLGLVCIREGKFYNLSGTNYTRGILNSLADNIEAVKSIKIELSTSKKDVPERLLAFHKDGYILELEYKGHENSWLNYAQYKLVHLYKMDNSLVNMIKILGCDSATMEALDGIMANGKCHRLI